jgi:hypothetical protein
MMLNDESAYATGHSEAPEIQSLHCSKDEER